LLLFWIAYTYFHLTKISICNPEGNILFNERHNMFKKKKTAVNPYEEMVSLMTDPNGSYTGKGKDVNEKPVQDADDL